MFLALLAFIFLACSNPRVYCSKKELLAETPWQVVLLQATAGYEGHQSKGRSLKLCLWGDRASKPWSFRAPGWGSARCRTESSQLKVLLCFGCSERDVGAEWWSQWVGAAEPQSLHVAWGRTDDLSGRTGCSSGLAHGLLHRPVWSGAGVYPAVRRGWRGHSSFVLRDFVVVFFFPPLVAVQVCLTLQEGHTMEFLMCS